MNVFTVITTIISLLIGLAGLYFAAGKPPINFWLVLAGLVVCGSVALAYYLGSRARSTADSAALSLRVHGGTRTPDVLSQQNIFRWYFLTMGGELVSPGGDSQAVLARTLYLSFEPEVKVTTLRVTSPDIPLPPFEVKEFNQRYAIIAFFGDVPPGVLEVRVGP